MRKFLISVSFCLFGILNSFGEVKLPTLFSDNMVLQQQIDAPVWGESNPNAKVEVVTSWNGAKYTVKADNAGKWIIKIKTPKAGGPYSITISDGNPIKLSNVMIGEVWICSGQSNMEMQVEGWGKVNNYQTEKIEANKYTNIRFFSVNKATSPQPIDQISAAQNGWQVCNSKSVADFSATAYFFGRELNKSQNVAIGLINTSWGGTFIEAWTSKEALSTIPELKERLKVLDEIPLSMVEREDKFRKDVKDWEKKIEKSDKGFKSEKAIWSLPDFDDSDWKIMKMPGLIQHQGLAGFNGIVWLRKSIDIPANWDGKELIINMGAIDDNDYTYFEGVQIGHTEGWMSPRSYKVPKNLVKKGKATISIRIFDTGGTGGINGNASAMSISLSKSDKRIPLSGDWKYKASMNLIDVIPMPFNTANEPNLPAFLFNAMLNPLVPYGIKGAIWYQGESNTGNAYQYRELMPLMINDWRKQWGYNFPFYMVQLANFTTKQTDPCESTWAELREAQSHTLHLDKTGIAVTIDIGEELDIHPKNKQEVGHRLALAARAQTYGENVTFSGPTYDTYKIEDGKIRIFFKKEYDKLIAKDGNVLKGFTIAGTDHKFYWADAVIDGSTIVVSSKYVPFPLAVRYAWADNPIFNLYNGANLPASPFRTDDWNGVTRK